MKRMKRPFAMLLCVAMVLSLCTMFAGADEVFRYDTLDAISEDNKIFRSIRTGAYAYKTIDGESYWQFHEAGFPIVQIKASAFKSQPNNGYLTEDNQKLSENCKNAPPANVEKGDPLEDGGAYRVCYYKTMRETSYPYIDLSSRNANSPPPTYHKYTVSMYRLELKANAFINRKQIYVEAKLTSGVTFVYDTGKPESGALHREDDKLPLVPNVSVALHDGSGRPACSSINVNMTGYTISGLGPNTETNDIIDLVGLLWSANSCKVALAEAVVVALKPETLSAASTNSALVKTFGAPILDCGFFLKDAVNSIKEPTPNKNYAFDKISDPNVNARRIFSPIKLTSCNHYVRFTFDLDNWRDDGKFFTVKFGFDSVKG